MTARITSRQIDRIKQLLGESLEGLPLEKNIVQDRLIGQGGVLKARFKALVMALAAKYFILLSDDEAHEWLRKFVGKSEQEAKRHILGYRRGTQEHEVPDSEQCHLLVAPEVTMKGTIPTVGPCVEDFRYLQGWNFPDPPTQESLFSLVPTLLKDSTGKSVEEQRELLAQTRRRLELPDNGNHLSGFGSATHLSGAALTYKAAGSDIFAGKIVRTAICVSVGVRLNLHWCGARLDCDYWFWGGGRFAYVGVLACGVEKALGR